MYLDWCFRGLANVNFTYKTLFFFSVLFFSSNLQGVIQGDFFLLVLPKSGYVPSLVVKSEKKV